VIVVFVHKFSSSFDYLGTCSPEEAIQDIYGGRALSLVDSATFYHSPTTAIAVPIAVRMTRGKSVIPNVPPRRDNIFKRDGYECQYCGSRNNLTLDHVVPVSYYKAKKASKFTSALCRSWENLVAACHSCNNKKANRTPKEAGLKLRREPRKPSIGDLVNLPHIWDQIAAANG
jgi:5-methylcytosine-specific restriction endonuclease McrA